MGTAILRIQVGLVGDNMKIQLLTTILVFVAILAGVSSLAYAASSTVTTILAAEDTYVDSAKPSTNFGGNVTTWVRGGSPTRRALLRFNLSGIPANAQISSAVLKLAVSSDGSSVAGNVRAVTGNWAQNTVTYSTAPQVGALIASLPNPASPGSTVSLNLTSYVTGKSTVSLYIVSASTDGVVYYTREKSSALAPRLIVTWSTSPAYTPTRTLARTSTPTRTPARTPTPTVTLARTSTPASSRTSTPPVTATPSAARTAAPTRTFTPAPSPTASSQPGGSLTLPLRLAFYYPWFPEAWT